MAKKITALFGICSIIVILFLFSRPSPTDQPLLKSSQKEVNLQIPTGEKEKAQSKNQNKQSLEELVRQNPKDLVLREKLSEKLFVNGSFSEAFKQMKIILQSTRTPNEWENFSENFGYPLALSLYEENFKKEEIIEILESLLDFNPQAHRIRAEIYRKEKQSSKAEAQLRQGVNEFSVTPSLHRDLAMLLFEQKRFEEAQNSAREWMKLSDQENEIDLSFDLQYQTYLGAEQEFSENHKADIEALFQSWKKRLPNSQLFQERLRHYKNYRQLH